MIPGFVLTNFVSTMVIILFTLIHIMLTFIHSDLSRRNMNVTITGGILFTHFSAILIIAQGGQHIFSSIYDITRRKESEEKLKILNAELENRVAERTAHLVVANKEFEAFTYSVLHYLRVTLRAVHGFIKVFQRLQSPREYEGNGIGPADGERIIQSHNVEIWAEGIPNKGAVYCFTLNQV